MLLPTMVVTCAEISYGFVWSTVVVDLCRIFTTVSFNFSVKYVLGINAFIFVVVTGPLTEPQIAYMCKETLNGLSYLHAMGKMHRDIKVCNYLVPMVKK